MVRGTFWPHFTPGKDPVPILQEAGWAPGSVWPGGKSRPHRVSIPDRPARSSVAIPTDLPGPLFKRVHIQKNKLSCGSSCLVLTFTTPALRCVKKTCVRTLTRSREG